MSNDTSGGCCAPARIMTRLSFRDGTKASVVGLSEILAAVYAERREANTQTAEEILARVAAKNYVPSSCRGEYQDVLLMEYRKYVAKQHERS